MSNGHGGKRTNAGRKPKELSEELKRVFDAACSFEERVEIFRAMAGEAKGGNVKAASLVFGYLYGTPVQRSVSEISGVGGKPIEIKSIEAVKPANARPDGDN
jgi:hypothetical protein